MVKLHWGAVGIVIRDVAPIHIHGICIKGIWTIFLDGSVPALSFRRGSSSWGYFDDDPDMTWRRQSRSDDSDQAAPDT